MDVLSNFGFTDIQQVGRGGMGRVFSARRKNGQRVALKVPISEDSKYAHALVGEAKVMTRLSQVDPRIAPAHIVFIPSHGEQDPLPVLVMDWVPGKNLRQLFEEKQIAAGSDMAREIQRQLHELMGKVHSVGIYHLDLSPNNIHVEISEGAPRVYLLDWGLALHDPRFGGHGPNYPLEGTQTAGSWNYFHPDRFKGNPVGERDDVYALRTLDWRLRLVEYESDFFVLRQTSLTSSEEGEEHSTVLKEIRAKDESDYTATFKQPAVALDDQGSERERLIAAAEFSLLPKTLVERTHFLRDAKDLPVPEFLKQYGEKLVGQAGQGDWEGATAEILASSVAIENLEVDSGLGLTRENLAQIVAESVRIYEQTRKYERKPVTLGPLGPHHKLRYEQMAKKVDSLHRRGILPLDWLGYRAQTPGKK
jgi:hypothetical protein